MEVDLNNVDDVEEQGQTQGHRLHNKIQGTKKKMTLPLTQLTENSLF